MSALTPSQEEALYVLVQGPARSSNRTVIRDGHLNLIISRVGNQLQELGLARRTDDGECFELTDEGRHLCGLDS